MQQAPGDGHSRQQSTRKNLARTATLVSLEKVYEAQKTLSSPTTRTIQHEFLQNLCLPPLKLLHRLSKLLILRAIPQTKRTPHSGYALADCAGKRLGACQCQSALPSFFALAFLKET